MPSTLDESGCPIYSVLMNDSANVAVQCDLKKQHENINYVKQRVFETDYIIRQYKKKILLDKSGKFDRLNNSQEYNEACTFNVAPSRELNNNYDVIPQAVGITSTEKAELEGRLASTEIKIQEMKSHINQLQMLVTEYETQIEALKIENQLQKCNAKEYNNLINDICLFRDIVLGKKKMHTRHKKVLKKYDKYKSTSAIDDTNASACGVNELDIFNHSSPVKVPKKSSKNKTNQAKGLLCDTSIENKKVDKGGKLIVLVNGRQDSDSVNEINSEDSGFSSLGLNSPDYYPNSSPCSIVSTAPKERKNYVDVATSPLTVQEEGVEVINTHNASSDITKSLNRQEECMNCSHLSNIKKEKIYADIGTSPITVQENVIEIIYEDKHCAPLASSEIDKGFNSSNLLSERSQKEKRNGSNPVQENQTKIKNGRKDSKPTACSDIENYFIELVSDHPSSDRLQEEKNNDNKDNLPNSLQENLVQMTNKNDKNYEPFACSEIENSQDNLRDISLSAISLKDKTYTDDANGANTVQENLDDRVNEGNDNESLCDSDIIEECLFGDSFITDSSLDHEKKQKNSSDIATSPITVQGKLVEMATSPIPFTDSIPNRLRDEISIKNTTFTDNANDIVKMKTIGINTVCIKQREIATSPIKFDNIISDDHGTNFGRLSCEVECLELNNSRKLNDSCFDCEVEAILRNMRLDCEFITPIPKTPTKSRTSEISPCYRCQDMAKLKRENENLQSTLQDIAKSMFNMTWLMKSRGVLVNNNLHDNPQGSNDFVMNVSTPLDTSSVNVPALNTSYEYISNDLHNSLVNQNQPTIATDNIKSFKMGEKENREKNNRTLNSPIENVSDDVREIVVNKNQPALDTSILQSIEICDNHNTLGNNPILNEPKENISDQVQVINQNEPTLNTDFVKFFEVEKEQNHEHNMGQSSNMHVDKENLSKSPIKATQKVKKAIKLTKLEKLKRKLLPKSKIRRALTPPITKDRKRRQILKKKMSEQYSKSILDNKAAYKKAVELMAGLRDKEKNKTIIKPSVVTALKRSDECKQVHIVLSKCDDMVSYISKDTLNDLSPQNDVETNDVTPQINDTSVQKDTHVTVETPTSPSVITRSRRKRLSSELFISSEIDSKRDLFDTSLQEDENSKKSPIRKGRKRCASERSESTPKRLLRGSTMVELSMNNTINTNTEVLISPHKDPKPIVDRRTSSRLSCSQNNLVTKDSDCSKEIVSYNDLDVFNGTKLPENNEKQTRVLEQTVHSKDRILCRMLEKYARSSVKFHAKKISEAKTNMIAQKLEEGIGNIISVPYNEAKHAMNNFVDEIQTLDQTLFVIGLMKYLKEPARKDELFKKVSAPPAPLMTKPEQVLLYILKQLQVYWAPVNIIETILKSIEFTLFQLNHTPDFGTVESLSHFYAILCRYFGSKSRLRLFMLDAMYCIQFKSVALIKQCLEVWMHILPLAHMGIAKSPLVMCLIYLLHFFKCEDRYNRVQEIRDTLSRKYFYQVTEWTESKMLEMFKNALLEIREIPVEKKMLRMALIILAKRRGPHWSQKNIIKDMIQPIIEREDVPVKVKEFCVSILGALLKPYPNDMRVHCEVVLNQLIEMLDHNAKPRMQEAIFTSLLYMRRHNPSRVNQALFAWSPRQVAPELEQLLKDYVREKPAKVWKHILSKISLT